MMMVTCCCRCSCRTRTSERSKNIFTEYGTHNSRNASSQYGKMISTIQEVVNVIICRGLFAGEKGSLTIVRFEYYLLAEGDFFDNFQKGSILN